MTTILIDPTKPIREGEEFHVFSDVLKVGEEVQIARGKFGLIGNPIASGIVEANGSSDERSKQAHSANGTARAWRRYWKIKVTKIGR